MTSNRMQLIAEGFKGDRCLKPHTSSIITYFTILIILTFFSSSAYANIILFRSGGSLNGQSVDNPGTTILVDPGEQISGSLLISVNNSHSPGAIVPVGATVTWGDRATQIRQISRHVSRGWTDLSFGFFDTAPSVAGLYHIVLGNRGECNFSQVMSATNWALSNSGPSCGGLESGPLWNDGNDLGWDWTPSHFQQAFTDGQVTQQIWLPRTNAFADTTYGANWIGVQVRGTSSPSPISSPSVIWLFGSGFLGFVWVNRLRSRKL